MEPTSRRNFLRNTSVAVAAAGVAAAVPLSGAHAFTDTNTHKPIPDDEPADIPVVAHVRDVRRGEVVLYTGEREVVVTDKRLAALLYHATR